MAHWYKPDGSPFYEVPNKSRGGQRPASITDARKVNAYPSVTAIIGIPEKPGLQRYFAVQTILAAFEWCWAQVKKIDGKRKMSPVGLLRFVYVCIRDWEIPSWAFNEIMVISRRHAKEAADKGSDIHDAIEAHYMGRVVPRKYRKTVRAVVALIDEHCGPQEWEAEKWFAHPLGYGGKIDLISPEWVIDFKTKPGEADNHTMYDDQLMQLVAYDMGLPAAYEDVCAKNLHGAACAFTHTRQRKKANVIVSRDIPGSVKWHSWDGADEEKQWDLFRLLLQYWQAKNDYWPHLEARAA